MQESENLPKGYSIFKEEIIPKGKFKRKIVRYLLSGNATHIEVFEEMKRQHCVEKSTFIGHPKEYSVQIANKVVIFSIY